LVLARDVAELARRIEDLEVGQSYSHGEGHEDIFYRLQSDVSKVQRDTLELSRKTQDNTHAVYEFSQRVCRLEAQLPRDVDDFAQKLQEVERQWRTQESVFATRVQRLEAEFPKVVCSVSKLTGNLLQQMSARRIHAEEAAEMRPSKAQTNVEAVDKIPVAEMQMGASEFGVKTVTGETPRHISTSHCRSAGTSSTRSGPVIAPLLASEAPCLSQTARRCISGERPAWGSASARSAISTPQLRTPALSTTRAITPPMSVRRPVFETPPRPTRIAMLNRVASLSPTPLSPPISDPGVSSWSQSYPVPGCLPPSPFPQPNDHCRSGIEREH